MTIWSVSKFLGLYTRFTLQFHSIFTLNYECRYEDETGHHPNSKDDTSSYPFIKKLPENYGMTDGEIAE